MRLAFAVPGETVYRASTPSPKRGMALRPLANVAANTLVDHYDAADWRAL